MNEYCINCDVTVAGNFYVKANSEEEARQIVEDMHPDMYDLRNFYYFSKEVQDIEDLGEVDNEDE